MERIRRNLNCPSLAAVQWRKESEEQQPSVTVLKIGDTKAHADEVIEELVRRMKAMGVAYQKNVNKNYKIAETDVSRGSVGKIDIAKVLSQIEQHERSIEAGEHDISIIQGLTTLYQKGIEYYSAFDNVMFTDLLNRMQSLLQREDIQAILNSVQESKASAKNDNVIADANPNSVVEPAKIAKIDFNVSEEDLAKHREEERLKDNKEEDRLEQMMENSPEKSEEPPKQEAAIPLSTTDSSSPSELIVIDKVAEPDIIPAAKPEVEVEE